MSSESPETIRTTTNLKIVFALRKNGVLILLLIVLLITDLILMRRTIISHKEIRIKDSVIHSIVSDNFALEYIGSNLFYTFEYDGMKIQDIPIKDTADRTVSLQKVVCEKPALIFRYQQRDCSESIAFGLSQLAEFAESASIQTIIFAGYSETYPFKQRTKTIQTKNIALYNIEKILPVDKQQIPYCFILHPDLHISELFIPDKSFPEVMKRYMQILKAKYSFIQ